MKHLLAIILFGITAKANAIDTYDYKKLLQILNPVTGRPDFILNPSSTSVGQLMDVSTASASDGYVLTFSSTTRKFSPQSVASVGLSGIYASVLSTYTALTSTGIALSNYINVENSTMMAVRSATATLKSRVDALGIDTTTLSNKVPVLVFYNEGTRTGDVTTVNCVGSAIDCTQTGSTLTLTITATGGSNGPGGVWVATSAYRFNQAVSTVVFVGAFIDSASYQNGVATITINGTYFWSYSSTADARFNAMSVDSTTIKNFSANYMSTANLTIEGFKATFGTVSAQLLALGVDSTTIKNYAAGFASTASLKIEAFNAQNSTTDARLNALATDTSTVRSFAANFMSTASLQFLALGVDTTTLTNKVPVIVFYDEGNPVGPATTINCVGSAIGCTNSGTTITVTISATGGVGAASIWVATTAFRFNQAVSTIVFVGAFVDSAAYVNGLATITINGTAFWNYSSSADARFNALGTDTTTIKNFAAGYMSTANVTIEGFKATFSTVAQQLLAIGVDTTTVGNKFPKAVAYDEGVLLGDITSINCVGSGIGCTNSGTTITVTVNAVSGNNPPNRLIWIATSSYLFNQPVSTVVFVGAFIDSASYNTGLATISINGTPFWNYSSTADARMTALGVDSTTIKNFAAGYMSTANVTIEGFKATFSTVSAQLLALGVDSTTIKNFSAGFQSTASVRLEFFAAQNSTADARFNAIATDTSTIRSFSASFQSTASLQLLALGVDTTTLTNKIPKLVVYDEGTLVSDATSINCVGSGIACTNSGTTVTVTVSGGGTGAGDNLGSAVATKTITMAGFSILGSSAEWIQNQLFVGLGTGPAMVNIASVTTNPFYLAMSTGGQLRNYEFWSSSFVINVATVYVNGVMVFSTTNANARTDIDLSTINFFNTADGIMRSMSNAGFEELTSSAPNAAISTVTASFPAKTNMWFVFVGSANGSVAGDFMFLYNGGLTNRTGLYAVGRTTSSGNTVSSIKVGSTSAVGFTTFGPDIATSTARMVSLRVGNRTQFPKMGLFEAVSASTATELPSSSVGTVDWYGGEQISQISIIMVPKNSGPFAGGSTWMVGTCLHVYGRDD